MYVPLRPLSPMGKGDEAWFRTESNNALGEAGLLYLDNRNRRVIDRYTSVGCWCREENINGPKKQPQAMRVDDCSRLCTGTRTPDRVGFSRAGN